MATENESGVEVIARFGKCQWCGSTRRMMEELGKELKEQGLIDENMDVGLDEVGGSVVDPSKATQMLSVSYRSGMFALRDICIDCGRMVTVKIQKKLVRINVGTVPLIPPGVGTT